jgi:hypothetical protein
MPIDSLCWFFFGLRLQRLNVLCIRLTTTNNEVLEGIYRGNVGAVAPLVAYDQSVLKDWILESF